MRMDPEFQHQVLRILQLAIDGLIQDQRITQILRILRITSLCSNWIAFGLQILQQQKVLIFAL